MEPPPTVPVPEEFGNPWMANLQEIAPPEPVAWWPPAAGWYVVAGLVGLAACYAAWRAYRRWAAAAYRREALETLERIETGLVSDGTGALAPLPALVKRVALRSFPRADVASLSGEAWLAFLDGTLGGTSFREGKGRLLPVLAYEPDAAARISEQEARALIRLARRWVRRHRRGRGR